MDFRNFIPKNSAIPGVLKMGEGVKSCNSMMAYNVRPPFENAKLVNITPITIWFMVLITIVNGVYKPTCNWGASHCMVFLL